MSRPLEGIKVVELGTHMAIPLASRMLSDWGADVIKVDPPKGEAWRTIARSYGLPFDTDNNPVFQTPNANKKDIAINLKSESGMKVMHELLSGADIFLTNTRWRSLEKLKLDYESIKDEYPRLIYAHFSAYGIKGEDKDRPGFDLAAYWARAGMPMEWTEKGTTPFRPMPGFGDSTVSTSILSGVLAALYNREKNGKGDCVKSSLYGSALWYNNLGVVCSQPQYGIKFPRSNYEQTAPYNKTFVSKDGKMFIFSIPNWNFVSDRFLPAIGLEDYIEDERFKTIEGSMTDLKTVMDTLDLAFSKMTMEEIRDMFKKNDFVYEEITNPNDVTKDQQAWDNDFFSKVEMENGDEVVLVNNPVKFEEADVRKFSLAPQIGEHTKEILKDLGYSQEDIDELIESKSVISQD